MTPDDPQPQQVDASRVIRALQTTIGQLHTDLALRDILIEDLRRRPDEDRAPEDNHRAFHPTPDLSDDLTLPLHQQ